jgi:hypothetical protein
MGLFLQKTNIIRDYLEDYVDKRAFWPQEVWKKYAPSGDLGELAKPEARERAVACLNELVTNALECVPECMQYLAMMRTEEVFRFCAIPQVMAIATLAELYDNPQVFTGVVKIRKGTAAKLILDTKTVGGVHKWFYILARDILRRVPPADPSAIKTKKICRLIMRITGTEARSAILGSYAQVVNAFCPVVLAASTYQLFCRPPPLVSIPGSAAKRFHLSIPPLNTPTNVFAAFLFMGSAAFILGYSIAAAKKKSALIRADP